MRWMVDQPESPNDILGARLRAKYYGAQVITYRPFVLQVLERSEPPSLESSHNVTEQISDEYLSEVKAPVVKHDIKDIKDIDPKALEYVRLGLQALIKSTTAFHGLGHPGEKRIIVTNVWGTAHAYVHYLKYLLCQKNVELIFLIFLQTMGQCSYIASCLHESDPQPSFIRNHYKRRINCFGRKNNGISCPGG